MLDNMPASTQRVPDAQRVKKDRGLALDLRQYMGHRLVQFDCKPMDYYRSVIRADDLSKTMVELHKYQCKHLTGSYHLEGKKFIGVGYDQGEFSKVLSEFPVKVHGIEYDPHLAELVRVQGLDATGGSTETEDTRFAGGLYDVFLSFNFLEYQPDLSTILQTIYRNPEDGAIGLTTVPNLEYITDHSSYYELIWDHLVYYTFETLTPLLEHNGFQVGECGVVSKDIPSTIMRKCLQMDTENLLGCYASLKWEMETHMKYPDTWDKKAVVWGADRQGFTSAATTKLEEKAKYIIDSAPFKQGEFAPTFHLPIAGPDHSHEHSVDAIIVMAPDYAGEMATDIRQKFGTVVEIRVIRPNHLKMVQEG